MPLTEVPDLRRDARAIFDEALSRVDAGAAVSRSVRVDASSRLHVVDAQFDLSASPTPIYSIAVGKAASAMASALETILDSHFTAGVISAPTAAAPTLDVKLSERWRVFAGGHPVPNDASLAAALAAFDLLRVADDASALIIFLVSGGGSAMMEWPRDSNITLEELREANRVLVTCGADIAEVNTVRRAVSAVKGGGLATGAPRAAQITLIISDTNRGDEANVASGPTFPPETWPAAGSEAATVIERYGLTARLPASVVRAVAMNARRPTPTASSSSQTLHRRHVLLDNDDAVEFAAEAARQRGFFVEVAHDLVGQSVDEGAREMVSRVIELRRREAATGRAVCLISGGEFACPVRGTGMGGRNAETALRCALELDAHVRDDTEVNHPRVVALCAGTDGGDGNSPANGALADDLTLARARVQGLDARALLAASDAYTFFNQLGDALVTGPTGTNVRDLRVMLAE